MAELMGLASSIATLAAAGFHLARKISTIADDLGTANAQIKSIAVDTKAVAIILRDIEAKLLSGQDSSRQLNKDTRDVLVEVLELCTYEIEDLHHNLAPLRENDARDTASFKQKAKWLFDKPKIAARQASLDSLKLTLSLLLHNVQLFDAERSQEPLTRYRHTIPEEPKENDTVVFLQPEVVAEPPPAYQVADGYQDKATVNAFAVALAETENRVASLTMSEVDVSNSGHNTSRCQVFVNPQAPPKLIEVQEKVRCLAVNKKERRDARRAEKAMKAEAWKERKQAKRAARAEWRQERRTGHARLGTCKE